ncbi:MAG: hypothetical protein NTY53_22015 [Kiritimatiellaeota bacterium]|nr:hypothetical protein [Kiritimatiellota bacterium]
MKWFRHVFFPLTALLLLPGPLFAAVTNPPPRLGTTTGGSAANAHITWTEIRAEDMDRRGLLPYAKELLTEEGDKWRHAQTEHFVLHFFANEGTNFAYKVAQQSEFFYGYISKELGGVQDRYPCHSHIFTFRNETRWKKFLKTQPDVDEWSYSFAQGLCMFLQQGKTTKDQSEVLAHEMTHLMVNHFIEGHPPLWLNEGVAEYYGEFGLWEFRGLQHHAANVFKVGGLRDPMTLERLFAIVKYPGNKTEVHKLYATSKYFVGFLLTKKPHEKFPGFLADIANGVKAADALTKHYDFADLATAQKEFSHFYR